MTNLDDLITRLEDATEGSRELDAEIMLLKIQESYPDAKWISDDCMQIQPGLTGSGDFPHYTTSIDAALTLVPEGWTWDCHHQWFGEGGNEACLTLIGNGFLSDRGDTEIFGRAATPAIAICIAALKAKEGNER